MAGTKGAGRRDGGAECGSWPQFVLSYNVIVTGQRALCPRLTRRAAQAERPTLRYVRRRAAVRDRGHLGDHAISASTSISIIIAGSTNRVTSTMVEAGRMTWK